jgi:puromycin-sensitive aminopeptidase
LADTAEWRLPHTAWPQRYELELTPDLVASRFDGMATITFDVLEPIREIVMNAADLDVQDAELERPDGSRLSGAPRTDDTTQRLMVELPEEVPPGEGYRLHLHFAGKLNDQLHGFYRSRFTGADGAEHTIATTQFEPADARRAFPCWDEPEFKATFVIRLVIDEDLVAMSNAAAVSETPLGGGRKQVSFAETMRMSTYLVAFVVGPFEHTEPEMVEGVPLRVAAVPGKLHLTRFALESGSHALRFLARYFEIPYPGSKIDHIAIPDFAFGAMENLGCVTYREHVLLVDPAVASQLELQRIAAVVAHETAHMWFGDLVTMKWWNGIWLNEAFATFMELTANDDFRPDWLVWTAFGSSKAQALSTDGLRATRPIEFPVGRPEEAEAMFDVLTYQKGAAVLRMLEQYLGPETFRKGISHYLGTHAYTNTDTGDLWDAIEAVSGEPVRAIMDSWIFQGGYPLVSVEAGDDDNAIRLEQRRFLYDARDAEGREQWSVPVNLRASIGGEVQHQRLLLDGRSESITFDGPVDWVVVNDGAWGFYRSRYSPDLMARLRTAGLATVCDPLERMSLMVDTWAAVVAGQASLEEWVQAVDALGTEDDPDVWAAVVSGVSFLDRIAGDGERDAVAAFVRRIAEPTWDRLGWDPPVGESRRLGITRGRVLSAVGAIGRDPVLCQETQARFERYDTDAAQPGLAPDLVTPAAHVAAACGGEAAWQLILDRYRAGRTPQDKVRYLDALASTSDPALLARTLDLALGEEVRSQDGGFLVAGVMSNRAGGRLAWEWLERRWPEVQARIPAGLVARIFESITSLVEPELAARVHRFLDTHEIPQAGPRLDQLAERMDINVALAARLRGSMAGALGG